MVNKLLRSVISAVLMSAIAVPTFAKPPKPPKPPGNFIELDIEAPGYNPTLPLPVLFSQGWPLIFKARATSPVGYLTEPLTYPTLGSTSFLIFEDPDDCPELIYVEGLPDSYRLECLQGLSEPPVPDETYLEFTLDQDAAGVDDTSFGGNQARKQALSDPILSGRPNVLAVPLPNPGGDIPSVVPQPVPVGPDTGGGTNDGFGYGADDDLPGLVVLVPHGVGLVYQDADGDPDTLPSTLQQEIPRTQRNLAGFLNWVNYELKANTGTAVIWGGMTVPDGLVAPLVAIDSWYGDEQGVRYSVDGGPLQLGDGGFDPYDSVIGSTTFTLRAFFVSGTAPSRLSDANGDGVVSAADATAAGYRVISNEKVIQLRQSPVFFCAAQGTAWLNRVGYDFDGNGEVGGIIDCPPGAGSIKPLP